MHQTPLGVKIVLCRQITSWDKVIVLRTYLHTFCSTVEITQVFRSPFYSQKKCRKNFVSPKWIWIWNSLPNSWITGCARNNLMKNISREYLFDWSFATYIYRLQMLKLTLKSRGVAHLLTSCKNYLSLWSLQ